MSWWERIFHRRHLHDELAEEMREHIEEKTEQLMRLENLSQEQARAAACARLEIQLSPRRGAARSGNGLGLNLCWLI